MSEVPCVAPAGGDQSLSAAYTSLQTTAESITGRLAGGCNPVARNGSAIQAFHDLGFGTLGHVQLFMSPDRGNSYWQPGPSHHGRVFHC
jgi:hypothetical protein